MRQRSPFKNAIPMEPQTGFRPASFPRPLPASRRTYLLYRTSQSLITFVCSLPIKRALKCLFVCLFVFLQEESCAKLPPDCLGIAVLISYTVYSHPSIADNWLKCTYTAVGSVSNRGLINFFHIWTVRTSASLLILSPVMKSVGKCILTPFFSALTTSSPTILEPSSSKREEPICVCVCVCV